MDTVSISISIGLFIIGVFLLIFILPVMNTKKRQKGMIAVLHALADRNNSIVGKKEIIGDVIVGLDETQGILYYCKHNKVKDSSTSIQLKNVMQCKLINQMKKVKSSNENYNPYEKIGLEFVSKEKQHPRFIWEFYNVEETSQLNFDIKLLEKWERQINLTISTYK